MVRGVVLRPATKQPKGGEVREAQQAEHRQIARDKMRIEPTLSSVKRCRIGNEVWRDWQDRVRDLVMRLACALHTLRLRYRPWIYDTP